VLEGIKQRTRLPGDCASVLYSTRPHPITMSRYPSRGIFSDANLRTRIKKGKEKYKIFYFRHY
ncbi:MAG TPA: hypothetical protein PLG50_10510, partial [bacterium]|nr:hypothetical protein [bacterium]